MCVWERYGWEITPGSASNKLPHLCVMCVCFALCSSLANWVAYTALFPPVVNRSLTCLILYRISHFTSAAMWTCLSVFVSVCVSVCHICRSGLFFLYTNNSESTCLISLCSMWTDRQTIQWKQTICLEALGTCAHVSCLCVCVWDHMCVCVVSASSLRSGFNGHGISSSM